MWDLNSNQAIQIAQVWVISTLSIIQMYPNLFSKFSCNLSKVNKQYKHKWSRDSMGTSSALEFFNLNFYLCLMVVVLPNPPQQRVSLSSFRITICNLAKSWINWVLWSRESLWIEFLHRRSFPHLTPYWCYLRRASFPFKWYCLLRCLRGGQIFYSVLFNSRV